MVQKTEELVVREREIPNFSPANLTRVKMVVFANLNQGVFLVATIVSDAIVLTDTPEDYARYLLPV